MGRDPRRAEKCDGWQQNSANARNRRRLRSSSLPTPAFLGSNGKAEARPSRPACTLCDCFSALKQIVQSPKLREGPVPEREPQEIGKPGPGIARPFALASGHDDSSLTYQRARGPSQARLHPAGIHLLGRSHLRLRHRCIAGIRPLGVGLPERTPPAATRAGAARRPANQEQPPSDPPHEGAASWRGPHALQGSRMPHARSAPRAARAPPHPTRAAYAHGGAHGDVRGTTRRGAGHDHKALSPARAHRLGELTWECRQRIESQKAPLGPQECRPGFCLPPGSQSWPSAFRSGPRPEDTGWPSSGSTVRFRSLP